MKEATLTAEFIIIGFVLIINLLFLGLIIFDIHDLKILNIIENYKEISIIFILATAYFLGGLTHRLATLYDKPKFYHLIIKLLPFLNYTQSKGDDITKKRSFVYQYGSEYLTSIIEKESKFMMLFKCFSILLFPLSFILSIWLFCVDYGILLSVFTYLTLTLISYLSFKAHKRQSKIYWNTILMCYDLLNEAQKEGNNSINKLAANQKFMSITVKLGISRVQ